MAKIDIISEFLGAGKATSTKKLLEKAIVGEQMVPIENEFDEIGTDRGFLKDSGIEVREMDSGCICCSLVGGFGISLAEMLTRYHPDRVIIEPSGVGKLSGVMKTVRDVTAEIKVMLNNVVMIVDTAKCKMYMKNFGEFFDNQTESAGTIVMSRADAVAVDEVQKAAGLLREHDAKAAIITTSCSQLTGAQFLEIIEKLSIMEEDLLKGVMEHHEHEHEHHHEHYGPHHYDCDGECGYGKHGHKHEHHGPHHHDYDGEHGCGGYGHDHEYHEPRHHDHDHAHGDVCSCDCGHDHEGCRHADEVLTSWGAEHVAPTQKEELDVILDELANGDGYGEVFRARGMAPTEGSGEWFYFDLIPDEYEIRTGQPKYAGKVCAIGASLNEEALKDAFVKS